MKEKKQLLHIRVNESIRERLDKEVREKRVTDKRTSQSSIVEAALEMYFDPNKQDERDAIIARQLTGVTKRLGTMSHNQKIMAEAIAAFVKTWLMHNPELPDDQRRALGPQVTKRYNGYLNIVAKNVAEDSTLYDTLPTVANVRSDEFHNVKDNEEDAG